MHLLVLATGCSEIVNHRDLEFGDFDAGEDAGSTEIDAGDEDAGPDAGLTPDGGPDACVPDEICNSFDDDCDGNVDEGFDLTTDEANCGACGAVCQGAFCADSECLSVTQVDAGEGHTCALLTNGEVWCWGSNMRGGLGDGTTTSRPNPRVVPGLPEIVDLDVGLGHTCAVTSGRDLFCWGYNSAGQIGNNTITNQLSPVMVRGAVTDVVAGFNHTCVITTTGGAVVCWGTNGSGQLGTGATSPNILRPADSSTILVGAIGFSSVSHSTTCAWTSTELRCWGENSEGQVGNGTTADVLAPVAVNVGGATIALAGASGHSCAVLTTGMVRCWGNNLVGRLGTGDETDSSVPRTTLDVVAAIDVSTGLNSSCAATSTEVYCWGSDRYGELGDGVALGADALRPVRVPGLSAIDVAAGRTHLCAITPGGALLCWGDDSFGQLGRGAAGTVGAPAPPAWE